MPLCFYFIWMAICFGKWLHIHARQAVWQDNQQLQQQAKYRICASPRFKPVFNYQKNAKFFVMVANKGVNSLRKPSSFPAQSIYQDVRNVHSAYYELPTELQAPERAFPWNSISFAGFCNTSMETWVSGGSQSPIILEQYLNNMHIFAYNAIYMRLKEKESWRPPGKGSQWTQLDFPSLSPAFILRCSQETPNLYLSFMMQTAHAR